MAKQPRARNGSKMMRDLEIVKGLAKRPDDEVRIYAKTQRGVVWMELFLTDADDLEDVPEFYGFNRYLGYEIMYAANSDGMNTNVPTAKTSSKSSR
jgi:hypothetical protein